MHWLQMYDWQPMGEPLGSKGINPIQLVYNVGNPDMGVGHLIGMA